MKTCFIHPHGTWGIYGKKKVGAFSIVLGGGFPDEDHGDTFTYIGSGGREPGIIFGPQTCDQEVNNRFNECLRMSACRKKPVRVIRGSGLKSPYAPRYGYRYDGLYTVSNPRMEDGPSGFKVCKFDFTRCADQGPLPVGDEMPKIFRNDIDARREQWQETRRPRAHEARSSPTSGRPIALSSLTSWGNSRERPISFISDDEDYVSDGEISWAAMRTAGRRYRTERTKTT